MCFVCPVFSTCRSAQRLEEFSEHEQARAARHWSPEGKRSGKRKKQTLHPPKSRTICVQPNKYWHCFGGNLRETAERRGGERMGVCERYDATLSWNWNWTRLVSVQHGCGSVPVLVRLHKLHQADRHQFSLFPACAKVPCLISTLLFVFFLSSFFTTCLNVASECTTIAVGQHRMFSDCTCFIRFTGTSPLSSLPVLKCLISTLFYVFFLSSLFHVSELG